MCAGACVCVCVREREREKREEGREGGREGGIKRERERDVMDITDHSYLTMMDHS